VGDYAHLMADLSTSAYIAGMALGSIIVPFFADRNGRRPALLISLFLSGSVGICSAFAPNIFAFIAMRFVQGISFSVCSTF
jgi:MFS family permease